LHEQADHFARIMTSEMGKRIGEAKGEVEFSSEILTYYAKNAERFLADVPLHPSHGVGHMESSPIGVIFCVEPWNFPYYQLARVAGPHLMAGNTVVVKHAMRDRVRETLDGRGRAGRSLHQPPDFA
jgi:succinate-semialdehyde dehydrogenase/glutarate-semialdehyde dehydrogenase